MAIVTFLAEPKELERLMIEAGLSLGTDAGLGDLSPLLGGVLLGSGDCCRSRSSRSRGSFAELARSLAGDFTNLPGFNVSL